jgi:hypothetical protein
MAHSKFMEGVMAGLDDWPDLTLSIDDAIDEMELLPFRYLNGRGSVC